MIWHTTWSVDNTSNLNSISLHYRFLSIIDCLSQNEARSMNQTSKKMQRLTYPTSLINGDINERGTSFSERNRTIKRKTNIQ